MGASRKELDNIREQIAADSEARRYESVLETLDSLYSAHGTDERTMARLGEWLVYGRDIDMLNAPPPEHPLFEKIVGTLSKMAMAARGRDAEESLLGGLATAARIMARQQDDIVERSDRRVLEIAPGKSSAHYNFGLFLKTRGRFAEGVVANQEARRLAGAGADEAVEWNLGICATGARQSDVALEVWLRMGQKIRIGRFGLPEGGYHQCKVRLAERPLAERSADSDDPGLEESIWIERLSPCHGIIRSVLFQQLSVDYGDVVLIDGAPVTYHTYGDNKIPVFPHLATLVRSRYQFFDFAATQEEAGQVAGVTEDLERDAIVYSHSEKFIVLCAGCWRDRVVKHDHEETLKKHVVHGRIAAPPDMNPSKLLAQIDAALATREPCRIFSPDLCEAAGQADRAKFERHRFDTLAAS